VLTAIWWTAIVVVLISAGVVFEVPENLARWRAAQNVLAEPKCQKDPKSEECRWQEVFEDRIHRPSLAGTIGQHAGSLSGAPKDTGNYNLMPRGNGSYSWVPKSQVQDPAYVPAPEYEAQPANLTSSSPPGFYFVSFNERAGIDQRLFQLSYYHARSR
jgi:hypothetical protein